MKMTENFSAFNETFCATSINEELFYDALSISRFSVFVPLSIFILHSGYQRWRTSSKASNSDIFTYNFAAIQLLSGFSTIIYFCGRYIGFTNLYHAGSYGQTIVYPGEFNLHILTCLDQYLAVVHPITYQRLKQSGGIRIRNALIICVWLFCLGWIVLIIPFYPAVPYTPYFCLMSYSVISIAYCSLSVLYALVQPGPGKGGRKREKADLSKRKAFMIITAILGVVLIYFVAMIISLALINTSLLNHAACLFIMCAQCFGVPRSLVLPMLFLRKVKKLWSC